MTNKNMKEFTVMGNRVQGTRNKQKVEKDKKKSLFVHGKEMEQQGNGLN